MAILEGGRSGIRSGQGSLPTVWLWVVLAPTDSAVLYDPVCGYRGLREMSPPEGETKRGMCASTGRSASFPFFFLFLFIYLFYFHKVESSGKDGKTTVTLSELGSIASFLAL